MYKHTIKTKMKAVFVEKTGKFNITDVETPEPLKGEVLIKVKAAPVHPADIVSLRGEYGIKKTHPFIPGLEGSGIVVSTGKGFANKGLIGRKVAFVSSPLRGGSWAEYAVTSYKNCIPLLPGTDFDEGSLLMINPLSTFALLEKVEHHGTIVITVASGALGTMLALNGKKLNHKIIAVVRNEQNLKNLKSQGIETVFNENTPDFYEKLTIAIKKYNATAVLDARGGELTDFLLSVLPSKSELYIYGSLSGNKTIIKPSNLIFGEKKIEGFWLNQWAKDSNFINKAKNILKIQLYIKNSLKTQIASTVTMKEFPNAIKSYKKNMSAGKIILHP